MSRLGDTRVSGISPRRVVIVGGIIGVVLLYLLVGLAVRQIFKREDYLNQYERQSSRYVTMPAARGDILDRHGNVLVSSRPRYSVVIDLGSLREEFSVEARKDIRAARREQKKFSEMKVEVSRLRASAVTKVVQKHLDRLNRVLGRSRVLDPAEVSRHLNEKRAIPFTLAKKLTPEEKARFLEAYPTDAPEQLFVESERTYPHGKLAAHLLGRLISDDGEFRDDLPGDGKNLRVMSREGKQGSFGIERRFDETIRGRDGYQLWQVDNLGYLHKKLDERLPEKGAPFISSLDLELQKATESALESRSRAGAAIVLDVQTGEGKTPLSKALDISLEMTQKVINSNNCSTRDSLGNTPLHIAISRGASHEQIVYLITTGSDINARNRNGDSPLFLAVKSNLRAVGELLLAKGADVFATNTENYSPLKMAMMLGGH